ncbi:hypothetical protein B9G69_017295 [Bdellovibrio sp. SKB1291214]|uniref:hypothetical protein n=1 Tax=Bdellovibrio sp. SKB1291214 TaxID=1732569 RepID=UPI000B516EA8|nr:hypothetical protein [Bdellovibrio sp. SKB1291214]UYL08801.1 hypothetical protein B9G69_017295 [Bdellovibrio sp. SKB1291214]
MRVFVVSLFLTLVVLSKVSLAAPTATTTLETTPLSGESDAYLSDKAAVLRTPAPTWQLELTGGFGGGNYLERGEWPQGPNFGLRFANLEHEKPKWDLQLSFEKDNVVGIFGARRWFLEEDKFIPYVRLALGTYLDPEAELANLVEIKRFRARAGVGLGEKLFFEFGFGLAVAGPDLYALLGYGFRF